MTKAGTNPAINGTGNRRCSSWIDQFVGHTANLESAPIFRKWAAIAALAGVLEQKVYVTTSSPLYPNLYVFLVGRAGIGKTRAITKAMEFMREIPDLHFGATSMTMAAMTDLLAESKRAIVEIGKPLIEYNSMFIGADELSAFMDQFDTGLIAGLTTFYDIVPYSQSRRKNDLRIKIDRPQLNIISGTTPSNLMRFIPEFAWEQGFTSRVIMIYSEDRPMIDVFNTPNPGMPEDMIYDLKVINAIHGQFGWTTPFANAMNNWKETGMKPTPKHPKLTNYLDRRWSHLLKLSMIACIDRGNKLELDVPDFNKAMGWLFEAENVMPRIFLTGSAGPDSQAMDEINHFIQGFGDKGVIETKIVNFARTKVQYANNVINILNVMERSGLIQAVAIDPKTGLRRYVSNMPE